MRVEAVRDDLEALVMDADVISDLLDDPDRNLIDVEIQISTRLRKLGDDPAFVELSERLENLRAKHEQGVLASLDFLKGLLDLARDVVEAEKTSDVEEDSSTIGKAALTELFEDSRSVDTPVIVERIVNDIDEIVRTVRFPSWQDTDAGTREVQKALRRTLLKFKLHSDQDLFDKAFGYIEKYY